MNRACPRVATSMGWMAWVHASIRMVPYSSSTTLVKLGPRRLSLSAAPIRNILLPFWRYRHNELSLGRRDIMPRGRMALALSQAMRLACLYVGATYQWIVPG